MDTISVAMIPIKTLEMIVLIENWRMEQINLLRNVVLIKKMKYKEKWMKDLKIESSKIRISISDDSHLA